MVTHASTDFELKTHPASFFWKKEVPFEAKLIGMTMKRIIVKGFQNTCVFFFLAKKEVPLGSVWEPIPLPCFLPRSRFENEA
jgi:hypothetical protein